MVQDFESFSERYPEEIERLKDKKTIPDKLTELGYHRVHWARIDNLPTDFTVKHYSMIEDCMKKVGLTKKWHDIVYYYNDSIFNDGSQVVVFYARN